MILDGAAGEGTTGIRQGAWINAFGIKTGLLSGTISIVRALDMHAF